MPRAAKAGIVAPRIVIRQAPGEGWHVSVIPSDRPLTNDLWFARHESARAFAQGMSAAVVAWCVTDEAETQSEQVERTKSDALAQLDLFITNGHGP